MKIPKGLQGNTARPGMGIMKEAPTPDPRDLDNLEGLELSREVDYRKPSFFKGHPENKIFDNLKTREYLDALKKDIQDAGAIVNPLIALPDGTLIEGHSRLIVAQELEAEGKTLGPLPVRFILSPMTPEEQARRVFLGNLSRFEIDQDTRLALYARIWPGYFTQEIQRGRPKKDNTVLPFPDSPKIIAEQTGVHEGHIKRIAKVTRTATVKAKEEGKDFPEPDHIAQARKEANTARKAKKGSTVGPFSGKSTAPQEQAPEMEIPGAGDPSKGPQNTTTRKETQEERAGMFLAMQTNLTETTPGKEQPPRTYFKRGMMTALDTLETYGFLKKTTIEEIKAQIQKALDDMNQGTLEI